MAGRVIVKCPAILAGGELAVAEQLKDLAAPRIGDRSQGNVHRDKSKTPLT